MAGVPAAVGALLEVLAAVGAVAEVPAAAVAVLEVLAAVLVAVGAMIEGLAAVAAVTEDQEEREEATAAAAAAATSVVERAVHDQEHDRDQTRVIQEGDDRQEAPIRDQGPERNRDRDPPQGAAEFSKKRKAKVPALTQLLHPPNLSRKMLSRTLKCKLIN